MRRSLRLLLLTGLVALVVTGAGGVGAQTEGGPPRLLEITKVVEGDGPTGGYVVEVTCTFPQGGTPSVTVVTFDTAGPGAPQSEVISLPNDDGVLCTIVETVDQGADSVAYECIDAAPDQTCIDDQTVEIQTVNDFSQSGFTVTNTFPTAEEPPTIGGDVVAATPSFTG